MTIQQLNKAWRAGKPDAVYLFYGEEEFLRAEMLQRAIDSFIPDFSLSSFNYDQLSGNDVRINDVIHCAKNYPVMAEMRVLICREAEKLFKVVQRASQKKSEDTTFDQLYKYLDDPNRSTLLIFDMEKLGNKAHHPWKELVKSTTTLEFPVMKEPAAAEWIIERAQRFGRVLDIKAATTLIAHIGTDLRTLSSELEKLISYVGENSSITSVDVESAVGISTTYNIFELQKAIGAGNKGRAIEIALRMLSVDKNARFPMFVMLSKYLEQIAIAREMKQRKESDQSIAQAIGLFGGGSFFVKDYISAGARYSSTRLDNALRSIVRAEFDTRRISGIDDMLLIEKLITEITP